MPPYRVKAPTGLRTAVAEATTTAPPPHGRILLIVFRRVRLASLVDVGVRGVDVAARTDAQRPEPATLLTVEARRVLRGSDRALLPSTRILADVVCTQKSATAGPFRFHFSWLTPSGHADFRSFVYRNPVAITGETPGTVTFPVMSPVNDN